MTKMCASDAGKLVKLRWRAGENHSIQREKVKENKYWLPIRQAKTASVKNRLKGEK